MFQIEVNSSEVNTLIRSCDSRVIDFDIDNWPLKEYGQLICKFFLPLNISIMRQDGKWTFSGFIATMITSQSCAGIRYECKNDHAIFFLLRWMKEALKQNGMITTNIMLKGLTQDKTRKSVFQFYLGFQRLCH